MILVDLEVTEISALLYTNSVSKYGLSYFDKRHTVFYLKIEQCYRENTMGGVRLEQ